VTGFVRPASLVAGLQTAAGHYAMLALDQRESLRGMLARVDGGFASDDALRDFKQLGVEVLSPHSSAVLLDRPFTLDRGRPPQLAPGCGLIAAVDVLHQLPGGEISHVTFDDVVTAESLREWGADAVKVLVLWHPESGRAERAALVERVLALAQDAGVASLVEGVVRPESGRTWASDADRHSAILACAEELVGFGPDIYKAQVPGYSAGDLTRVEAESVRMSGIVGGDWVVLSNGVEAAVFPEAVAAARSGGASGFLAGRAIWADTVAEADQRAALSTRSVGRLDGLTAIVDGQLR
jgi:sulfofructosephosphate aldolase